MNKSKNISVFFDFKTLKLSIESYFDYLLRIRNLTVPYYIISPNPRPYKFIIKSFCKKHILNPKGIFMHQSIINSIKDKNIIATWESNLISTFMKENCSGGSIIFVTNDHKVVDQLIMGRSWIVCDLNLFMDIIKEEELY